MLQYVESMWVLCCDSHTISMMLRWCWIRLSELCRTEVSLVLRWAVCDEYSGFLWRSNIYVVWWIIYLEIKLNYFPNWTWFWYAVAAVVIIIIMIVLHCIRLQNTIVGVHMWICWKLSRNKIKTQFDCSAFIYIYIFSLIAYLNY